jgi:hypothetical protein
VYNLAQDRRLLLRANSRFGAKRRGAYARTIVASGPVTGNIC